MTVMTGFESILKHLCGWLLAVVFGALTSAVHAAGFVSDSAWLEDPSGRLSFAQVEAQAQAFHPYRGVLTKGYTASTYWLRLRIAPTSEDRLVLRIRPAYIDHIELFDPLMQSAGNAATRVSGDRYPRKEDDYQSLNHGFTIKGSEYPRDVYLRLQSTSTMLVHAEALTVTQAAYADERQVLLDSAYLGILLAFMIWALLQWLSSREPLIAAFLGKQTVVLAHAVTIQGYLPLIFADQLSAAAMDSITSTLVLGYVGVSIIFMLLLLREFKPVAWLWWLLASLLLAYLPIGALFLQGQVRLALQLNMIIAAIGSVVVLLVAISARAWQDNQVRPRPPLPRWVLVSFNVALLLAAFSSALPSLSGIGGAEWNLNAPIFGGFINSLLMTVLLGVRAHNLEKNRVQALLDLSLAEQEANNERQKREEQERFLAMLTHELKTPLGVARISLGASKLIGPQRDRIERALANINAIVDRCRISDQLEHRQLQPQAEPCELMVLVDDCVVACNEPDRVKVLERIPAAIQSDSQLLAICLANLLDNALKYSPPNADVTVRVRTQKAESDASVDGFAVDIGNRIGSAGAPDAARIFSKYYRSRGALSKSGSGLGLYLTRSIAQLLGGQLTYRVDGDQVEFSLWIPA